MITEIRDRIEQRLTALGLTATAASKKAGLNGDAIRNIRRAADHDPTDTRERVTPRTLAALAVVLKTTPEWLRTGKNGPEPGEGGGSAHPLAYAEWNAAASVEGDQLLEGTSLLKEPVWPASTFVTRVPDDAMNRLAPAGSYVVVDQTERLVSTGLIYLGVLNNQVIMRRWFPNPERAEPFSTDPTFETIFIKPGQSWHIIGRVRRIFLDV